MANLPEKNITTVDKVTSIPSNTNLYINANGEFRQATVDDVLKASPVIADSIANQYKNATGSPLLITDSAEGVAIDFDVYGRSTQDGEPNPDYPQAIKSVGDMGYFDGELLQGFYDGTTGVYKTASNWVCSADPIPCTSGDIVNVEYSEVATSMAVAYYDENMAYISYRGLTNVSSVSVTIPSNAKYFYININTSAITPQTAKHICVTINDKYALIVDSVGKNKADITRVKGMSGIGTTIDGNTIVVDAYPSLYGVYLDNSDVDLRVGETYIFSVENVDNYNASGNHGFRLIYADGTLGSMSGLEMTATIEKEVSTINFYLGTPYTGNLESRIEGLMIRPAGTDATYEPYIHSRKYIPISAPLRGIGDVTDVASLSECEVDRKFTKLVFDGSSDEIWRYFNTYDNYYNVSLSISNIAKTTNAVCSHFKNTDILNVVPDSGKFTINANRFVTFGFSADIATTLDEWKTWLQANPITVVYELGEPTIESIEPVEIVTYDNVTHISVSDNADMEVEYPTSKAAGIASIGWSKGRRAEYDLEQLKAQMLALQTTIVNTV